MPQLALRKAGNICFRRIGLALICPVLIFLCGCEELTRDTKSLLLPEFQRSEIFGVIAGFGTTFAAFPDLLAMFKRRSTAGMNPRMVSIMACFQVLWIYYGILIVSRPVVVWNLIAVLINGLTIGAYFHFQKKEREAAASKTAAAR